MSLSSNWLGFIGGKLLYICICGKEFIGNASKYSTNRFCSRSCANTRDKSEETKRKISESLRKNTINFDKVHIYEKNPNYCKICNQPLPYKKRNKKTCGKRECISKCTTQTKNIFGWGNCGGYRKNSGQGKGGYYNEIRCDSTYELAYVIYCLDHNIKIERCKEYFEYEYQGEET